MLLLSFLLLQTIISYVCKHRFHMYRKEITAVILLLTLSGLRLVAATSVSQACDVQPCFSGVVSACGSCLPTSTAAFCTDPCQPSWGGSQIVACLSQAGDSYWLQTVQSLNQKCGVPPGQPSATAAGGTSQRSTVAPAVTPVIVTGQSQSLSGSSSVDPNQAGQAAAAAGQIQGQKVAAAANAQAAATRAAAAQSSAINAQSSGVTGSGSTGSGFASSGDNQGATTVAGVGTGGTAAATGNPISSAVASFGCATNSTNLTVDSSSACVFYVTNNRICPANCASQFSLVPPLCRNTMVQDIFYGSTWRGLFTTCGLTFSTTGQTVPNSPAVLTTTPVVASAASSPLRFPTLETPLLLAAAALPPDGAQSATIRVVSRLILSTLLISTAYVIL